MHVAKGLIADYAPLNCRKCGKDLLKEKAYSGNVVFVDRMVENTTEVKEVYVCCKKCDRDLLPAYQRAGWLTSWKDLSDVTMPVGYLMWIMAMMNSLQSGDTRFITETAWHDYKQIVIAVSQLVFRDMTPEELQRMGTLRSIPDWLGGLG